MKISAGTVTRTILMVLGLINAVLVMCGKSVIELEDGTVETVINALFSIITTLWAWWKNNSFTKKAIAADNYLKRIRES